MLEEHKNRQGEVARMKTYKNLIFDHHFLEFIFLPALRVEQIIFFYVSKYLSLFLEDLFSIVTLLQFICNMYNCPIFET